MNKSTTILCLALVSVLSAWGEVSAKKKVVEPVAPDTLTMLIQTGDSLMHESNTYEALKYFQQAYARCDSSLTRIKLADCYYKRGNYFQTANLLKNAPAGELTHEAILAHYQELPEEDAGKDLLPLNSMLRLIEVFDGLRIYQLPHD